MIWPGWKRKKSRKAIDMAIAITIMSQDWLSPHQVRDQISSALPGVDIRCSPDLGALEDIEMLVCDKVPPGLIATLPNLRFIQKLGAGVETMVRDADLHDGIRISRLKSVVAAREIAEYCLLYVLSQHRHARQYADNQAAQKWQGYQPELSPDVTVGVLGLGHIGARIATTFSALDFTTLGWSRSEKTIPGVTSMTGDDGLSSLLGRSDYVISILPATNHTRGLMNTAMLAKFKSGSTLINVGRGDLIVDGDLITALSENRPGHAVLDVFHAEPLVHDHSFWRHPQVTITPHVSGWNVVDSMDDVAENYRRLQAAEPLLHEIDRQARVLKLKDYQACARRW
jgi:glyoxylate/hydroxypyruvate reductase A